MNKSEKFWDNMANQFDKRAKYFEQPPVEKSKKYLNASDIVIDYAKTRGSGLESCQFGLKIFKTPLIHSVS